MDLLSGVISPVHRLLRVTSTADRGGCHADRLLGQPDGADGPLARGQRALICPSPVEISELRTLKLDDNRTFLIDGSRDGGAAAEGRL